MSHRCLPAGLAGAACAVWALSCSGGDGRTLAPDAAGHTEARLSVIVTAPRGTDPASGNVTASAHLVRFRDVDAEGAQLLTGGSPWGADVPPVGRCVVVNTAELVDDVLASLAPEASVEMLDAGNLVFRAAGRAVTLAPRYVPELLPFVTGAAYDAERGGAVEGFDSPLELDQPGDAWASAAGGDDVGRFEAQASLPAVPWITSQRVEGGVLVTWPTVERVRGGDESVVLSASGGGVELRCRAADAGRFVIPWGQLGELPSDGVTLAVERTARAPFAAAGLDAGELVVTVRDLVPLPVD